MKLFKYSLVFISILSLSTVQSCREDKGWTLIEEGANILQPIHDVQVINGHGQALIQYKVDNSAELLYVKAEYMMANGKMRVVKSSQYKNEILIDGFPDTQAHEVTLYAVNKAEVASDPITVEVNPKTPIFDLVFSSLKAEPTFGGVRLTAVNEQKGDVVIVPLVDRYHTGEFEALDSYYSSDSLLVYNIRGLEPMETDFAFHVRDRWLNTSDTLYASITPYLELLMDRNLFSTYNLPGDAQMQYGTLESIWDGDMNLSRWPSLYTVENAGEPQTITFSIGQEAQLSRIVIFPRRENGFYDKGNLRNFEVWASNNPSLDGSFDSWDKLGTYTVVKPSGTPSGSDTAADEAFATAGWSFDLPEGVSKYKYIRIRNLRNWRGSYFMQMAQIQIWGSY